MATSGVPNFPRAMRIRIRGKGSGKSKFRGLVATQGPTMVLPREEFLILRSLNH